MIVKDSIDRFRCFKLTWKYYLDKGIYLILITLLPSLLLSFLLSPSSTMYYLFTMDKVDTSSLANLFLQMWDLPYSFWYIGFIGLVLLVPAAAISFGVIDRHMRVGEFTISPKRIFTRLNFNILTALKFVIVAFLALEFYNVVCTLFYFLWANVFSNPVTTKVFSSLTLCIMEFAMVFTMSRFIMWPPYMLHTGMKSGEAFRSAWNSISGRTMTTVLAIVTSVAPLQIIMIITATVDMGANQIVCRTVLDGISYAIVIPFYLTLMYNIFYDVTGTERMDITNKNKNIWSKK